MLDPFNVSLFPPEEWQWKTTASKCSFCHPLKARPAKWVSSFKGWNSSPEGQHQRYRRVLRNQEERGCVHSTTAIISDISVPWPGLNLDWKGSTTDWTKILIIIFTNTKKILILFQVSMIQPQSQVGPKVEYFRSNYCISLLKVCRPSQCWGKMNRWLPS